MKKRRGSTVHRACGTAFMLGMLALACIVYAGDVFVLFPTLAWQIDNNMEKGMDKPLIFSRLREYGNLDDPAFITGMQQILAEETYQKYRDIDTRDFPIDGTYEKWKGAGEKMEVHSKAGPVIPQYDITEFRYFMDRDHNLFVMFKAKAKPLTLAQGNQSYIIWVTAGSWPYIRMQFKNAPNDSAYKVYDGRMPVDGSMGYGKWYNSDFESITGEIAEAKIPLGELFALIGIPMPDTIWIQPEARYQAPGKEYFNGLEKIQLKTNYRNPALRLLMLQLSGGVMLRADENPLFNESFSCIMSRWSGLAVDLLGNNMNEDATIGQWPLNRASNQQWKIVPIDRSGNTVIISRLTGKCIDVLADGGRYFVVQKNFTNSNTQKWRLVDCGNGGIRILSKKYNMALDIENGSKERWVKLVLTAPGDAESQQWIIQPPQ